jgi:site-specific DNA recombinase
VATYRIVARSRHDQAATVESLKEEPTAKREGEDEIIEREVTSLLAGFATVWTELFRAEQARIVQLLVKGVDVQEDALEVRIRAEGLASLVGELRQQGERMAA